MIEGYEKPTTGWGASVGGMNETNAQLDAWFDGDGEMVDLAAALRRADSDMVRFAFHSLGWIRLTEAAAPPPESTRAGEPAIVLALDPAAVQKTAIDGLAHYLLCREVVRRTAYRRFVLRTFDGQAWSDQDFSTATAAIKQLEEKTLIAQTGVVPSTVMARDLDLRDLDALGVDNDSFAIPFKLWRLAGGKADEQLFDRFTETGLLLGRTKILQVEQDNKVIVRYYGAGVLWSEEQSMSLIGKPVSAMPDQVLGMQVENACRRSLDVGKPLFEQCSGVIMSYDGPKKCRWRRLTLPCITDPMRTGGRADVLITITESNRPPVRLET